MVAVADPKVNFLSTTVDRISLTLNAVELNNFPLQFNIYKHSNRMTNPRVDFFQLNFTRLRF